MTTTVSNRGRLFRWTVNGNSMDVQWDKPILQYVAEGNTSYPAAANVVTLDTPGIWTYWIIENLAGGLVSQSVTTSPGSGREKEEESRT